MTINVRWQGEDGTSYAIVQYKPAMAPHMVITRPGEPPRGRRATDDELAAARAIEMERTGQSDA